MTTSDSLPHRSEKEIFFSALEKNSPEERAAFLDEACGTDPLRRARVDALLDYHFQRDTFMEDSAIGIDVLSTGSTAPWSEGPGTLIGPYKILQKLGEGGFGVVYMAEQRQAVKRRVALKIIRLGMDTRQVVARFEAERQALAMMDHPNIAKVFDAGATDSGRPYFVMELVRGIPITSYCDENHLSIQERLALFTKVCRAIQHAHHKGIIHRDIKPSNIMVTLHDGVPVPKVIDFGIAKATQHELTGKTLFTQFNQMIGTPAYMSPEQAEMSGLDIDTRSDIYSLGVLLYELLTGRTPLDGRQLLSGSHDEMRRQIREDAPLKPSTCARTMRGEERATAAKHRQVHPSRLGSDLKGDLDWIVLKTLEKDRNRRYETANDLAADVKRYLSDKPIVARPPSALYLVRKMIHRHKAAVIAGALVALALAAGITAVIASQLSANREYRQRIYVYQMRIAQAALEAGEFKALEAALDKCPEEHRHWEWDYLRNRAGSWNHRELFNVGGPIAKLLLSRDGKVLAATVLGDNQDNASVRLHAFPSGRLISTIAVPTIEWHPSALSPDGKWLALIPRDDPSEVQVWDTHRGTQLPSIIGEQVVEAIAFSPDGRLLAVSRNALPLQCWNVETGLPHEPAPDAAGATALAFAPDGQTLAMGNAQGEIRFVAMHSGQVSARCFQAGDGTIRLLEFSPDGEHLLSDLNLPEVQRSTMKLWDVQRGSSRDLGASGRAFGQFCHDGTALLVGGKNGHSVSVLGISGGEEERKLRLPGAFLRAATHPDGGIVSGQSTGTVVLTDQVRPAFRQLRGHEQSLRTLRFSPDGMLLASSGLEDTVRLWRVTTALEMEGYTSHWHDVPAIAWSRDGSSIVAAGGGEIHCWNPDTLEQHWITRSIPGESHFIWWLDYSPDGRRILSGSSDGTLNLWDAAVGSLVSSRRIPGSFNTMDGVAWSPDGDLIAVLFKDRIMLWKVDGWQEQWSVPAATDRCIRFSHDGRWLAYANKDGSIGLRDVRNGKLIRSFERHQASAKSLVFSRDGRRIFSGGTDGNIRIWDTQTGDELLQISVAGNSVVWSVDLSPDGNTLAAADSNAVVTMWQTQPSP